MKNANNKNFNMELTKRIMSYFKDKNEFIQFAFNSGIYKLESSELFRYIKGERCFNDTFIWYFCKVKHVKIESILPW